MAPPLPPCAWRRSDRSARVREAPTNGFVVWPPWRGGGAAPRRCPLLRHPGHSIHQRWRPPIPFFRRGILQPTSSFPPAQRVSISRTTRWVVVMPSCWHGTKKGPHARVVPPARHAGTMQLTNGCRAASCLCQLCSCCAVLTLCRDGQSKWPSILVRHIRTRCRSAVHLGQMSLEPPRAQCTCDGETIRDEH
jgi:hypothetical protein